jgi:exopolyphosphatase / guanosine-5'-triphosphate,3'-diphosphate pyrophosphatase
VSSIPVPEATRPGRVAALDCGTNSTRLLIVDRDGSTHRRFMRITRLGEGVDATHLLAPNALQRTLSVLKEYRSAMDEAGVTAARLVATSAVRDARNGDRFLRDATDVVGVPAELLDGQTEGALACRGATAGLTAVAGDDVVVDIGGGSTELAVRRDGTVRAVSLDIGCVRLTERFLHHDPPSAPELEAAAEFVRSSLHDAQEQVLELAALRPGSRLVGLAGSVTTLAALDLGLDGYDPTRTHHAVLTRRAVDHWYDVLAGEPASARAGRRAIAAGREDVIAGGALVLREVMRTLGFDRCVVSETDILDGLAMSLLDQ